MENLTRATDSYLERALIEIRKLPSGIRHSYAVTAAAIELQLNAPAKGENSPPEIQKESVNS